MKQAFDNSGSDLHKMQSAPWHKILCQEADNKNMDYKILDGKKKFPSAFRHFLQNFNDYGRPPPIHSSPVSVFPSSRSRCSCILAAEAVRKRTRFCFTSSSAACTASSVRAKASSAYSLAT